MAIKPVRILYQSRINALGQPTTDLTNVKAQIYIDGAPKAVGANAVTLIEVDKANAPGVYEAVLSSAFLTSLNAQPGQHLEAYINGPALANAPAVFRQVLTAISTDDIEAHLGLIDTAVAGVKTDTAAIRVDLETGPNALGTLSSKLDKIINNSGFAMPVPDELLRPGTGTNKYRIPATFYNDTNEALIDPDGNAVIVRLVNQAGDDRSSYLTGYVAGSAGQPGSAPMVRDSMGQYHIDITIPSTAAQEQLIFSFAYAINGQSTSRTSVSTIVTDVQAQGFALQTTLLDVQTRATDIQSKVNDASYGLAAANTLQQAIRLQTDKLGDASIGLAALRAQANANATELGRIEGQDFDAGLDSLRALGVFLRTNLSSGGRAV